MNSARNLTAKKVLIFSLVYYPRHIGGAEVAVKEITDRIDPQRVRFDMVTLVARGAGRKPGGERIGNVTVHRVGSILPIDDLQTPVLGALLKVLYIPLAVWKAINLHRTQRYDIVWPIMASYGGFAALIFKKLYPKVKMVLTIQEGDNFERRDGALGWLFRRIFKAADCIQAISNFLAEWSRSMGATCPISVVPNGVDAELFSRELSPQERVEIDARIGKKPGDVILVTTSRLVEKNGIADVIDALNLLPPQVKFVVIGSGELEGDLKARVSDAKLVDRVIFLGFMPHAQMARYVRAADVFIRPSLSEGLGNSFLEAMAADVPVIATPVGGIPDFLTDGETGFFCEPNDPESIAQKVEKLIKDPESRDYVVHNAKKMVLEKYAWEGVARRMEGMFFVVD